MRRLSILALALICGGLAAGPAVAKDDGISGYSGMSGKTCTDCHGGGAMPTVELIGPPALPPGATGTFTLAILGGEMNEGGLDVAASDGTLVATESGTYIDSGELTHSTPRGADGDGNVLFSFDYTAPTTMGTETLWGAGLSTDADGRKDGDGTDTDVFDVEVRELALYVSPEELDAGDDVTVTIRGGKPGGPALLVVVAVNGFNMFQPVLGGVFNGAGEWGITGPTPTPGGLDITMLGLGVGDISQKVVATNLDGLIIN